MQFRKLGPDGPSISAVGLGGLLLSINGRPPEDQALRVIHAALDAGINFLDTADSYCLDEHDFNHNEKVIAKALRGRDSSVVVATKVGCLRPRGAWTVDARPETILLSAERSLEALRIERFELLQLYAPDVRVPFKESLEALAQLRSQGKARHIGLCNVSLEQLEQARKVLPIASVQNRWNVRDRRPESDGMLAYCEQHGLLFIAYSPFGGTHGAPALGTIGRLGDEARKRRMTPYRLLITWMISKSPAAVVLAGARRVESIVDSARAGDARLSESEIAAVESCLMPPPQ